MSHTLIQARSHNNKEILTLKCGANGILNTNNNYEANCSVRLSSVNGVAVYADTLPIPYIDEELRDGWKHKKIAVGTDKLNYYFYAEGNQPLLVKDLTSVNATLSIDNYQSNLSLPFFIVYTKLQGSNNAGLWFHSSFKYTL